MRIATLSVMLLLAAPALAQPAPSQADVMQQLQKMMASKDSQQVMGQALTIASMLGCTQKTAGKEATQAFYSKMQGIGKTVEGYCKQGNATEARALLLATVVENANNPVTKAALGCYDQQSPNIAALGGASLATKAANYARWVRNPEAAKTEMKESDVCVKSAPQTPNRHQTVIEK